MACRKTSFADVALPHLRDQFARGLPILFTGGGFSRGARNVRGEAIPRAAELKEKLWKLCFPGSYYDPSMSLQSLYEHAILRHQKPLTDLLRGTLTVDPPSVPSWYATLFSMPWLRSYTLNIEDIESAVACNFELPRSIEVISATSDSTRIQGSGRLPALQCVHLNGTVSDIPDQITFSLIQYARRLARPEPWYVRFNGEISNHSCIFIGTQLDETPFWQHLQLRQARGDEDIAELRPRSYVVIPFLDFPRRDLLAEYNIVWIPMTAEEFTSKVLVPLSGGAKKGIKHIDEAVARISVAAL